jgi:Fur family ferric uptake transcriptional regulator
MPEIERWLQLLEQNGGRLTTPRKALVELLASSNHALGPIEIYDLVRKQHPKVGLVTVYRTLDLLAQLGLVERIHLPDGCHMILRSAHGHEHVVLCTGCGRAEYFAGEDISEWIESVSRKSGFDIQGHWLQLQGLCGDCQNRSEKSL